MKISKLNNKGFSLVELMVVVAIIGILATIGIPQYQKFMAKARQAEAKTHLNSIFQGETSFFTEYNAYVGNLSVIGAGATGTNLRYNAGFSNNDIATCTQTPGGVAAATNANNDILSLGVAANWRWNGSITEPAAGTSACATPGATFRAAAWGNPTNVTDAALNNRDVFTINEAKVLNNPSTWLGL